MFIKSIFTPLTIILFAQLASATEALHLTDGIFSFDNQPCKRPRTESWSQRADVSQAIDTYKSEIAKLDDLFTTCEEFWRKMPDLGIGQPFIGNKKLGDAGFIDNAPNTRFLYIQDIQKYLKRFRCSIELLDSVKMRERDIGPLPKKESQSLILSLNANHQIGSRNIFECLYNKVNNTSGMRDYGLTFTKVTKTEWNNESALCRFERIIGNPYAGERGTLQKEFEALSSTIDAHTFE